VRPSTVLYARFKTASGFYLYDTFSNEILGVSRPTWNLIEHILQPNGDVHTPFSRALPYAQDEIATAITELTEGINAGYLRPCGVERLAFYSDESELQRRVNTRIRQLSLELTTDCNLRCEYCRYTHDATRLRRHSHMHLETALKAVRVFLTHSNDAPSRAITFWGGEPLLRFPMIRAVIAHVERHYADRGICFNFTTNATLLTADIAAFLADHQVHLLVSLDGPRLIHDRHRIATTGTGTFDRVAAGLCRIRKADPDYYLRYVSFNCTLTPGTSLRDVFTFFSENPLCKGHNVTFVRANGADTPFYQEYGPFTIEQEAFLRNLHLTTLLSDDRDTVAGRALMKDRRLLLLARRRRTKIGRIVAPNACCVPLLKRMLVDPEGNIHICQEVPADNSVGNVNREGIDAAKVTQIVSEYTRNSVADCRLCWAVRLCSACFTYFIRERVWAPTNRQRVCQAIRSYLLDGLEEYASLVEAVPRAPEFWKDVCMEQPM
jgi:uncharacterized protein